MFGYSTLNFGSFTKLIIITASPSNFDLNKFFVFVFVFGVHYSQLCFLQILIGRSPRGLQWGWVTNPSQAPCKMKWFNPSNNTPQRSTFLVRCTVQVNFEWYSNRTTRTRLQSHVGLQWKNKSFFFQNRRNRIKIPVMYVRSKSKPSFTYLRLFWDI